MQASQSCPETLGHVHVLLSFLTGWGALLYPPSPSMFTGLYPKRSSTEPEAAAVETKATITMVTESRETVTAEPPSPTTWQERAQVGHIHCRMIVGVSRSQGSVVMSCAIVE